MIQIPINIIYEIVFTIMAWISMFFIGIMLNFGNDKAIPGVCVVVTLIITIFLLYIHGFIVFT